MLIKAFRSQIRQFSTTAAAAEIKVEPVIESKKQKI